jgi:Fe-S-cluster-containing dehydrogenase component
MEITRRNLLQGLSKGVATALAAGSVSSAALCDAAAAEEARLAPQTAIAMLYDATLCIGCKTCEVACSEANGLPADTRMDALHQAPRDLNDTTKSIIKLYKPQNGEPYSYIKQQCMHCVDPACVAACMFKALEKDSVTGIVSWKPSRCVCCRYCEVVCPYHIPKFQWHGFNARIVKCEFCKDRLTQGEQPACTSVCPTHAVIFGKRTSLLQEARTRIAKNQGKYCEDRVFGEHDGGGTQVLYLTAAPFEKLGLPKLGNESIPRKYLKWQKRIYSYMAFPVVLYAGIVCVARKNWMRHQKSMKDEEKTTGLRPQL